MKQHLHVVFNWKLALSPCSAAQMIKVNRCRIKIPSLDLAQRQSSLGQITPPSPARGCLTDPLHSNSILLLTRRLLRVHVPLPVFALPTGSVQFSMGSR